MQECNPSAERCANSERAHSRSVYRFSWPESDKFQGRRGSAPDAVSAIDKR